METSAQSPNAKQEIGMLRRQLSDLSSEINESEVFIMDIKRRIAIIGITKPEEKIAPQQAMKTPHEDPTIVEVMDFLFNRVVQCRIDLGIINKKLNDLI
jgi:hypothetical protein